MDQSRTETYTPSSKSPFVQLLYALLLVVTIAAGWYAWYLRQAETYTEGIITITNAAEIAPAEREQILDRVARPFVDFMRRERTGEDVDSITISKSTAMLGPDDSRYNFSYTHRGSSQSMGFLFGDHNRIDYWIPPICDDGGCYGGYPEWFKQKYPATYQAYLRSSEPGQK